MISFRYHLVTIVAVFLALGLGLLAGSTVLEQGLVSELENQSEGQLRRINDLRGQVSELRTRVEQFEGFALAAMPYLASGRLAGSEVIVVTQEGVDDGLVARGRDALEMAEAVVVAELSVTPKMGSGDPAIQEDLAALVGLSGFSPLPDDLPAEAARALGDRLATQSPISDGSPSAPDLLRDLLDQNFLVPGGSGISGATLQEIGGDGQVVVVLVGGSGEPFLNPEDFMVPLVESLVEHGVDVAAGETTTTEYEFVGLLRSGDVIGDGLIVTVDDLDLTMGGVALVLGLQNLITSEQGGSYGIKGDADDLIPPLP